jgi:hypothetical protein
VPIVSGLAIGPAERGENKRGDERSADAAEDKAVVRIARRDDSVIGQPIFNVEDHSPDDGDCADEQNDRIEAGESECSLRTRAATKVKDNGGESRKQKGNESTKEGTREDEDQRNTQAG